MSTSLLYTYNGIAQTVPATDTQLSLGTIIRRYGKCINFNGTSINITGPGYYKITVIVNSTLTAAGSAAYNLSANNVPIASSVVTTSAAAETHSTPIQAVIRIKCCGDTESLTLSANGAAGTVDAVSVIVEKL